MSSASTVAAPAGQRAIRGGLLGRQLDRYPANGPRAVYLGIVVLATIILYYELYVPGAVSTKIIEDLHFSLAYFITVSVVGNAVGAIGSLAAGLADRWGRANLVVYGLLITGLLVLFGLPNASSKVTYLVLFALVSVVEGVILVATPALIRDFSPQLGRASAMGFWTLGPVIGSLVVTEVASHTLASHPDWRFQFRVCGIVGLVVFAIAFVGLRELAPQLRDQLMISLRDRALVEARARNLDADAALKGHWRQMFRGDIVGPAFAISVFLLFYYIAVGFFVVFYATTFGYSEARANALANWYWIGNAITLVVTGVLSDALKVRKPFMVVGGVISAIGVALFALRTTQLDTGYYHFAWIILLIAVGGGMAFASWMAGFTETVESHNPAATATGLAVWGSLLRVVVTLSLIGLIFAIPAAGTLVDKGPRVQQLATTYAPQLATLQKLDPGTQAALGKNPNDQAAQAKAVSEIAGVPEADVVRTVTLGAQYKDQLATLQKIDPTTQAALAANPNDQAAQAKALSDISGVSTADVVRTVGLSTQYRDQLTTAQAVDQGTLLTLSSDPTNAAAVTSAVGQIASKLKVDAGTALQRLQALAAVPKADLTFLLTTGPKVQQAATALQSAAQIPAADVAFLGTTGKKVSAAGDQLRATSMIPKDDLAYLQANAADVQAAQKHSPGQWQRWWWICFAGQIVFLPFIGMLVGRWNPAKARRDAAEHDAAVQRELQSLAGGSQPAAPAV